MTTLDKPRYINGDEQHIGSYGLINRQKSISVSKQLLERLYLRLYLIRSGFSTKNDYEKNESEILKIETQKRIAKLIDEIKFKEDEFVAVYKHLCGSINTNQ